MQSFDKIAQIVAAAAIQGVAGVLESGDSHTPEYLQLPSKTERIVRRQQLLDVLLTPNNVGVPDRGPRGECKAALDFVTLPMNMAAAEALLRRYLYSTTWQASANIYTNTLYPVLSPDISAEISPAVPITTGHTSNCMPCMSPPPVYPFTCCCIAASHSLGHCRLMYALFIALYL